MESENLFELCKVKDTQIRELIREKADIRIEVIERDSEIRKLKEDAIRMAGYYNDAYLFKDMPAGGVYLGMARQSLDILKKELKGMG